MSTVHTRIQSAFEGRSADAFLVAGVLLLASPTHVGLELFLDVPLPSWLVALFVLPGLFATLVGLAGLYPRIADRAPRLGLVGGVITVVAGAILLILLGWVLGNSLLTAVSGLALGTPPGAVFMLLSVSLTLAFVLFGIASMRFAVPSRSVGFLLLSFALPWVTGLSATAVYGPTFPAWLTAVIYGPIPFVLLATGYMLRLNTAPTTREDAVADMMAG